MKGLFIFIFLFSFSAAHASPTFEEVIRTKEPLGKTVLSSIEQSLVSMGYKKGENNFEVLWDNDNFTATLWYVKTDSAAPIKILIEGNAEDAIVIDSVKVEHHRP